MQTVGSVAMLDRPVSPVEIMAQQSPDFVVDTPDQVMNTAGVYQGGTYGQAEALPESAASREQVRMLGGLGNVATRGVALAPEGSYADQTQRAKLFSMHLSQMVTFLDQMRILNETLTRKDEEPSAAPAKKTSTTRGLGLMSLLAPAKSTISAAHLN